MNNICKCAIAYFGLIIIFISGCQSNIKYVPENVTNLIDTKWNVEVYPDCINSFEFNKDTAFWYSCEDDTIDGTPYRIENDTIIIEEYIWGDENKKTRTYWGELKFIVFEEKLLLVHSLTVDVEDSTKIIKDKWIDQSAPLSEQYFYQKE